MLFLIKPTLQLKSLLGQTAFSCVGGNLIRTVSRRILSLGKDFKAFPSRQWIRDSVCPPRISSRLKEPYATSRSWWQIGGLPINLIIQPNWARVGLEAPFMIYSESFYSEKFHSFFFLLNTLKKQGYDFLQEVSISYLWKRELCFPEGILQEETTFLLWKWNLPLLLLCLIHNQRQFCKSELDTSVGDRSVHNNFI